MHCINLWIGTFSRCSRKMLYLSTTAELHGATNPDAGIVCPTGFVKKLAEGVGFEPTVELLLRLISSQVPLTTQPPLHRENSERNTCYLKGCDGLADWTPNVDRAYRE